jgi:hypothetical protein
MEWEAMQRKHAQSIALYLKSKGYERDVPNNVFIKRYGDAYFDFYEIRYYFNYILIADSSIQKIIHKTYYATENNKLRRYKKCNR